MIEKTHKAMMAGVAGVARQRANWDREKQQMRDASGRATLAAEQQEQCISQLMEKLNAKQDEIRAYLQQVTWRAMFLCCLAHDVMLSDT